MTIRNALQLERFGRIALKILLWVTGSIIFLILLVFILIQIPAVQNFAKNQVVSYLQGKIKTKVRIDHLSIDFPKMLVLQGVYFADQKGDTLIAGDKLKINIAMLQLFHHKVEINEINLKGITANIIRTPDSVFNYDYIVKAFASDQKKTPRPTDTTSTLKFSLDKIILDKINIGYNDAISGNDVKFILNHFDTRIKEFNQDKMKFSIPKITLAGFNAKIVQKPDGTIENKTDTTSKPVDLKLNLGIIDISKVHVDYTGKELATNINWGKLLIEMDNIDLKNQQVGIKNIQLNDTKALITLFKPKTVQKAIVKAIKKLDTVVASPQSGKGWVLKIARTSLANNHIKFDNQAQNPLPKGIDYNHMDIHNLNMDADNLAYNPEQITGRINRFTFSDKSGLNIKKLHTTFLYGEKQSYLNDLYLETPQSVIRDRIQIGYQSIATIADKPGELRINANLKNSTLGLKDALIIMPTMASMEPFKSSPNAIFKINGKINGQVNNLRITGLDASGLSNTHIKGSAILKGLPDVNKGYYDVKIDNFNTNAADIAKLVPKNMIPANVSIPAVMNLRGTFKGSIKNFSTNLNLRSSTGNMSAIASMQTGKGKGSEVYSADIKTDNLDAGKLFKQEKNIGIVNLSAKVEGSGTELKTAIARFSVNIADANVMGYTYHNMAFNGTANRGLITTAARMKDPNINFTLNAKANMTKKYPAVDMTLMVDSVNLQKLNFTKDDIRFHGKLIANIPTADASYLNGNFKLTDIVIANKGEVVRVDSVNMIATASPDSSTLRLQSQMLTAHLAGKYKLTEIGPALQDAISKYYNTSPANAPKVKYAPTQFTFEAKLVKTPLVTQFIPDLKQLNPVNITGSFDSQSDKLVVNGLATKIIYGTDTIRNLKLVINTDNNMLNYNITADQIKASQINLLYPSMAGNAQNNKLSINLLVKNPNKKERYRIAGILTVSNSEYQFSFLPDGLLLDYTPWNVNANNSLEFGAKGILAKNFSITNANQVLSVSSSSQQYNAPLSIDFNNFRIETLTKLAEQNSMLVGGVMNGKATITHLDKSAEFTSDMNITDFSFKGDTVGNIALKVNNQTANAYAVNMTITGKGNQVNVDGYYYTDKSSLDINLNMVNFNLKSMEGFSFGNLKQSSGSINGKLKITGTATAPVVRGDVNFTNAAFNIAKINSYYKLPNETVTFNNDGILFRDFTLIDSAGNKAVVTGTIYTTNYTAYKFGLDIRSDNFRVFNASQANNKLYFGQVYLNSRLKVRGDMNKPIVDGTIKVNEKTHLTIVLPQADPGIEDRKGVVEFVNKKAPEVDSLFKGKLDSIKRSGLTGMDVSVNITTDRNAEFIIVMDERNGDIVHLKGDAQLNGGIDPSGKTNLTGTYTVNEGSYNLSYLTINRKFIIKQGSTITWEGDPTLAKLDLTATYIAKVAPIDLVENQLTDEVQRTMYKQKLPFHITLTLRGELLKPDITFGIILPSNTNYNVSADVLSNVNNKLDQLRREPNQLNKQVFAVLLLNHFIGDNPLQSAAGSTGIEGQVRSSVSSLLSDQLNQLAGNLITGVELNFNLQSGQNYSTGIAQNRTDLNVGLSKRFLNDRLTVSVGNNFNLEGQQANEKTTNIAGNISVGYKLTKDGRYMIRAYRKDEYIVIQGQVVETGVGFSLTVDYNKFSQIFKHKTPEEKELMQQQKKQDKADKEKQKAKDEQQNAQPGQHQ